MVTFSELLTTWGFPSHHGFVDSVSTHDTIVLCPGQFYMILFVQRFNYEPPLQIFLFYSRNRTLNPCHFWEISLWGSQSFQGPPECLSMVLLFCTLIHDKTFLHFWDCCPCLCFNLLKGTYIWTIFEQRRLLSLLAFFHGGVCLVKEAEVQGHLGGSVIKHRPLA